MRQITFPQVRQMFPLLGSPEYEVGITPEEAEYTATVEAVKKLIQQRDYYRSQLNQRTIELRNCQNSVANLTKEVNSLRGQLSSCKESLMTTQGELNKCQKSLSTTQASLRVQVDTLRSRVDSLQGVLNQIADLLRKAGVM